MKSYSIVLDVWEGQLEIDEAALFAGGVVGLVIRLNDMNGGHHMDEGFEKQWAEAASFLRWPYFVYNPWVSGAENYDWLARHMPSDCPAVALDIEVRKTGLAPKEYGKQIGIFKNLVNQEWNTHNYTGEWFLDVLSPWPIDDYWWAQYPFLMYPASVQRISYEVLKAKLDMLVWPPMNSAKSSGKIRMWQCSGDRLILPGTTRAVDVNVFNGNVDELRTWLGYSPSGTPINPPEPLTIEQRLTNIERVAREHGWSV
jgi:hypothetical protein